MFPHLWTGTVAKRPVSSYAATGVAPQHPVIARIRQMPFPAPAAVPILAVLISLNAMNWRRSAVRHLAIQSRSSRRFGALGTARIASNAMTIRINLTAVRSRPGEFRWLSRSVTVGIRTILLVDSIRRFRGSPTRNHLFHATTMTSATRRA